jgi:hypothetical protein
MLATDFVEAAHAIARKTGTRVQPSGAFAADLPGLSAQVPANIPYLPDGLSRAIRVEEQTISFNHTSAKELLPAEKTAMVVHALRFLDKEAFLSVDYRRRTKHHKAGTLGERRRNPQVRKEADPSALPIAAPFPPASRLHTSREHADRLPELDRHGFWMGLARGRLRHHALV